MNRPSWPPPTSATRPVIPCFTIYVYALGTALRFPGACLPWRAHPTR
jgi:hypothetical protein